MQLVMGTSNSQLGPSQALAQEEQVHVLQLQCSMP